MRWEGDVHENGRAGFVLEKGLCGVVHVKGLTGVVHINGLAGVDQEDGWAGLSMETRSFVLQSNHVRNTYLIHVQLVLRVCIIEYRVTAPGHF